TGGNKCSLRPVSLGKLKTQHAAVEAECALQVGHLEMHMADANLPVDEATNEGELAHVDPVAEYASYPKASKHRVAIRLISLGSLPARSTYPIKGVVPSGK